MDGRTEYINAWKRNNTRRIVVQLNRTADGDIINRVDSVTASGGSLAAYIKRLIREDITRTAGHGPQDD